MNINQKIVDYKIVHADTLVLLESRVLAEISIGWQPFGPLVLGNSVSAHMYFQPLVLHEDITDQK